MKKVKLPTEILILGAVSLLTDISSEMIYPLLPVFLTQTLSAAPWALGLIEGLAETVASALKLYSGLWSDRTQNKKKFLLIGYAISGSMRPLVGVAQSWPHVLLIRFSDRIGKGIRTTPRDHLIGSLVPQNLRGRAFGFHRSMDHLGALLGPLVATLLMSQFAFSTQQVFLAAYLPAVLAFAAVWFFLKDPKSLTQEGLYTKKQKNDEPSLTKQSPIFALKDTFRISHFPPQFKYILLSLFIFTLGNATDAFLLIRLNQAGVQVYLLPIIWSIFHAIKMTSSMIGGMLSDKWGRKPLLLCGWFFYALIYTFFALPLQASTLILVFIFYGVYYGLTEPTEKAWIVDMAPAKYRGQALGLYNSMIGFGSLPASVIFGFIWEAFGANWAFSFGASCAFIGSLILLPIRSHTQQEQEQQ